MQQDLNMNTYTLVYDIYARARAHTTHTAGIWHFTNSLKLSQGTKESSK